jgi:hypothetical protein
MPAKTVNLTLKTQSEKSGPSEQVTAKSSELILGQTQSRSQSMPVRGLCSGIYLTREQAYSGNEIGPNAKTKHRK